MKMRAPKPGQLAKRDSLWKEMESAHKKLNLALRKGDVPRDAFKTLWGEFVTARKAYDELGADIPEIEVP